ncbi:MAG: hypothetical protein JWP95_2067 [Actinotalea sp.]|nr:hypothetical protein [Actinotalea sp.]
MTRAVRLAAPRSVAVPVVAVAGLVLLVACADQADGSPTGEDAFWEAVRGERARVADADRAEAVELGHQVCADLAAGDGPASWRAFRAGSAFSAWDPLILWDAAVTTLCPGHADAWADIRP